MTPAAARATAREMLREVEQTPVSSPEFRDRAAVLADVLAYTRRPDLGEALALVVAGRSSSLTLDFAHLPAGSPIPKGRHVLELASALRELRLQMFGPRRPPCMPNPRALHRLVYDRHGDGPIARRLLRELSADLRMWCRRPDQDLAHVLASMHRANDTFGGNGLMFASYTTDGAPVVLYYVDMGDDFAQTLIADAERHRYLISSWDAEADRIDARFGGWGQWYRRPIRAL